MLTQEDLQALAGLINTAVTASEERMTQKFNEAIAASEAVSYTHLRLKARSCP